MLRKLTDEAWEFYLKILDIDRVSDYSIERENRIHKLIDRAYFRYARRRVALELYAIKERQRQAINRK